MKARSAIISAAAALLAVLACSGASKGAALVKKWDSGKVFSTPESVIYDAERYILYVANIEGSPSAKDGNGFISKLSMKGKVEKLKWITGLDGPKGMAIFGRRLFVSDIDKLVEIDIEKGTVVKRYQAEGAAFLNDVTVDPEGNVYVSDSAKGRNTVYRLSGGTLEAWVRDERLSGANGLCVSGGMLIVGAAGEGMLMGVSLKDRSISDVAVIGTSIDGIAPDGEGDYIVSDWSGKTVLVDSEGGIQVLLDTTSDNVNAADIWYIAKYKMLLIPTFHDDRVVACTLILDR
jgi:sugar lactone lactonase YvrE